MDCRAQRSRAASFSAVSFVSAADSSLTGSCSIGVQPGAGMASFALCLDVPAVCSRSIPEPCCGPSSEWRSTHPAAANFAACPSLKRRCKRAANSLTVCSLRQHDVKSGDLSVCLQTQGTGALVLSCLPQPAKNIQVQKGDMKLACFAAPPSLKLESRTSLRMGVPSKGRMAEDTMQLLKVLPPLQSLACWVDA